MALALIKYRIKVEVRVTSQQSRSMNEGGSAAADEHVAGLANYVEKGGQQMEK